MLCTGVASGTGVVWHSSIHISEQQTRSISKSCWLYILKCFQNLMCSSYLYSYHIGTSLIILYLPHCLPN